ncbi:MAG: nitrogen fixation negative regulator NifL [Azoarcus sp.]|jgi:nitrogen fixation negative regulator NifL|nr:nitrogen fixation negative regulator NifL [Azoarcus sp.]
MKRDSSFPRAVSPARRASRAPQALRQELLEAVVDEAPIALALIDAQGRIVLDNQEYKKLIADLGAREPAHLILETALPSWRAAILEPGFPGFRGRELRIDRPGAVGGAAALRWLSCSLLPVRRGAPEKSCLLLAVNDVSNLHRGQEKMRLAVLHAHLADEEHADVLRESLSAALFRLEGPLNLMKSAAGFLRHADPAVSSALDSALAEGHKRLEELRQLIPPERREAFTSVNLNEVLHGVLDVSTPRLLKNGITVSWRPAAILPAITGRPMQLHALFKALVDNAIDALSARGCKTRELRLATRVLENDVQVFVDDCGPGVPAELRLKAFEPFFTTWAGRHLGTGLSRALEIACEHGGAISLADAPGGGCRACVELPAGHKERLEE